MPWCPKCKNEYREGITMCADCGCALIEGEQAGELVSLIFGEEEQMTSLKKYLDFNKIRNVGLRYDEAEDVYELQVCSEDQPTALKLTRVFLEQEMSERISGQEAALEEALSAEKEEQNVYYNNAERAEENRSSAWTLLVVGVAGIIVMLLGFFDLLPFRVGNAYLFYGVMSAVFLLFIVMGVVSMRNAKIFARKAESENSLKDTMIKWCRENLIAEDLDAAFTEAEDCPEELLYFKRCDSIREKLNRQFMNLDQAFLDRFIDEEVYDIVYGEKDN